MGKASVSNIVVSLGFVIVPKALTLARLSAAASFLRSFLSPPPGSVRFHRTATILSAAGTLLLITGWHPTATLRLVP